VTSDALNAGLNLLPTLTDDIDGEPRPAEGSWDIGADEQP